MLSKYELTTINKRALSYFIDDMLISILLMILIFSNIENEISLEMIPAIANQYFVEIVIIKFLYQTYFIWYYGGSIGKIVTKTRVIMINNSRVTLQYAALRSVARLISESFYMLGFAFAFFNKERQTLHDFMAKTKVIDIS